jgi:hypothetical protein
MNPKEENEVDIVANHTELKNVFDASKITKIGDSRLAQTHRLQKPRPVIVWSSLHPK